MKIGAEIEGLQMQLHLNGKNLYIVKKKPQQADIIEIISNVLKLKDKEGNILKQGQNQNI